MNAPSSLPVWQQTLFLAVPTIVVCAVVEIATRLLFDPPPPPSSVQQLAMTVPDEARVWRYKPNYRLTHRSGEFETSIETRGWGLRDEDPDPSDEIRVLAIGDSFTFGWGVEEEERYSEVLQKLLLEALPGRRIRVINAGYWMYTFDQHLLVAKELVPELEPDVVVHGVYPGHVLSIANHAWTTDENNHISAIRFEGFENEIVVNEEGMLKRTNRLIQSPPLGSRFLAKFFQKYYRWKQVREVTVETAALFDPSDESLSDAWSKTERALRELAEYMESQDVAYIPFEIPMDVQIDESEQKPWFVEASVGRTLDTQLPGERFARIFEGTSANWLPLLDVFRAEFRPGLYFEKDPHWTREGHRLAAAALAPAVLAALGASPAKQR